MSEWKGNIVFNFPNVFSDERKILFGWGGRHQFYFLNRPFEREWGRRVEPKRAIWTYKDINPRGSRFYLNTRVRRQKCIWRNISWSRKMYRTVYINFIQSINHSSSVKVKICAYSHHCHGKTLSPIPSSYWIVHQFGWRFHLSLNLVRGNQTSENCLWCDVVGTMWIELVLSAPSQPQGTGKEFRCYLHQNHPRMEPLILKSSSAQLDPRRPLQVNL